MTMKRVPKYRLHKATKQAVVTLPVPGGGRRDYYLGNYGTPESRAAYRRVIAEATTGGGVTAPADGTADPTIAEMLLRYFDHARTHYRDPVTGQPTGELHVMKEVIKSLRTLYGPTPAREFTPLSLKAVRQKMVDRGLSRGVINSRVNRVRRVFKWAASEMLVPFLTYQALTTVQALGRGRSAAREVEPVRPVDMAHVEATLPFLPRHVAGLVRLLAVTGMRPGEACRLRMKDVDVTDDGWVYKPDRHKTAYAGIVRAIPLGPKAQAVVREFAPANLEEFVFSPSRARAERYDRIRSKRQTPVQPSQVNRSKRAPRKLPGAAYTTTSLSQAVRLAVIRANKAGVKIPCWAPGQLRHTVASSVRAQFGIEAAGAVLGHSRLSVTEVYAERDLQAAKKVAAAVG
jgi:integrase